MKQEDGARVATPFKRGQVEMGGGRNGPPRLCQRRNPPGSCGDVVDERPGTLAPHSSDGLIGETIPRCADFVGPQARQRDAWCAREVPLSSGPRNPVKD
jgi:hypothetical protein